MSLIHLGTDPKWFQENMGRGGAIPLKSGVVEQESPEKQQPEKPVDNPAKE